MHNGDCFVFIGHKMSQKPQSLTSIFDFSNSLFEFRKEFIIQ
jgi:hypothetical protein